MEVKEILKFIENKEKELSTYKETDKEIVRNLCSDKNKKIIEFNEIYAIENILNRLEQDERVIEEMAKHIDTYTYRDSRDDYGCDFQMQTKCVCNDKDCNECIIDHFRKKCE